MPKSTIDEVNIGTSESIGLDDDEKLDKFKTDVTKDAEISDEQRDLSNEDVRFINAPGGMWEDFLTDDGSEFWEDRTRLQFDIISSYTRRFIGEWNLNRAGVDFKPDDDATSDDDAELLNGVYRADFKNFDGKMSVDNAVDEVVTCGYGAFKIASVFEDEGDPENDKRQLVWRPIFNAYNSVIWDQSAQRIDKKDARWVTVLKEYTDDSFHEAFGEDIDASSAYVPNTRSFSNRSRVNPELIYVGTRYEIVKKRETVFIYHNIQSGVEEVEVYTKEQHDKIKDELADDETRVFVRERRLLRRHVEKTVFSGSDILEQTRTIAGQFIPIIPMYGYHVHVDGVEFYKGLVRDLKDANRVYNMQISQLSENAASAGQEVPIFTNEQIKNPSQAAEWARKNNKPYLTLDPVIDPLTGTIFHVGPVGYSKPPQLDQSTATLMQAMPDFVRSVTGGAPQDTLDPDASGKAINSLLKRENLNTQIIVDNISNAIVQSGEIYQSMVEDVYNVPRMVRTLSKDGIHGRQHLFRTIQDEETGMFIESNKLHGRKFRAYPDSGPQYETMREQVVEELKGMLEIMSRIEGAQPFIEPLILVMLENITGTGLEGIKQLGRQRALLMGLVPPETEQEEQLLQQAQQQSQQPDEQQQLTAAITSQQNAEAQKLQADIVETLADAEKKGAETEKIEAETAKIEAEIGQGDRKLLVESRDRAFALISGGKDRQ